MSDSCFLDSTFKARIMQYCIPIKVTICLRALSFLLFSFFITNAEAQNDATLTITGQTILKSRAGGLGLNKGVKGVNWKEESLEGVKIEVRKNGATVSTATSGKKGKFSIQIPVSITDSKNDYVIYFSREGTAPRTVYVNGFLSKEEFAKNSSGKYDAELNMAMVETSVKDIVPDKPFAKIKWDQVKEHKFTPDQLYAKTSLGEERKIEANPDVYYSALVKKQKKQQETVNKNKAAAEAKLKAMEEQKRKAAEEARLKEEAEAQRQAALKAKEEADRLEMEKAEAARIEMRGKHIADSLAEAQRKAALVNPSAKLEINKIVRPLGKDADGNTDRYDASDTYSINIAKRTLTEEKEKKNREKASNLSTKYETINTLTSLLNEMDEYDKGNRRQ